MPYDYFIRITFPYQRCIPVITRWAMECDKMAVYEHTGEIAEKVHVHIAIKGSRIQSKALKLQARRVSQLPLNGNANCSMKSWDGTDTALVYMTKGNLTPSYLRGWSEAEAEQWRSQWVAPTPARPVIPRIAKIFEEQFATEVVEREWRQYMEQTRHSIGLQYFVRKRAHRIAMSNNHNMITPKTIQESRTLYLTFCYRNGIRVNANDPMYRYVQWQQPVAEDIE
jgi:hypothetical protein